MSEWEAQVLVDGDATGEALVLTEPLSFWGGLDSTRGSIVGRHPAAGRIVTRHVLVMPSGRGSSSSPSVLAESLHRGTGPAAIVLAEPDHLVALGALVHQELYGSSVPVVVAPEAVAALQDGEKVRVSQGRVRRA